MKCGKAAGTDGIKAEMFQCCSNLLMPYLVAILILCRQVFSHLNGQKELLCLSIRRVMLTVWTITEVYHRWIPLGKY